ncbi:polyribonucleotide nucleotidyltransferase [Pseudomonas capeferrum]|uniref:polyribonucleotide nucleotidyltransferase n=1 Tax=Pseudomonas TaxID=286 RepID=UPI003D6B4A05
MRIPSRVIGGALIVTLLTQLTACGTLFYPDRRGQTDGKIDPVVAAMDAIGILFYVIPGLIAFGIDFATGAIYYPGGRTAQVAPEKLREALSPDGKVDNLKLQAILESELGQRLPLNDPRLIQQRGSVEQLAAYQRVPAA